MRADVWAVWSLATVADVFKNVRTVVHVATLSRFQRIPMCGSPGRGGSRMISSKADKAAFDPTCSEIEIIELLCLVIFRKKQPRVMRIEIFMRKYVIDDGKNQSSTAVGEESNAPGRVI